MKKAGSVKAAALNLARRGWAVFPIKQRDKSPGDGARVQGRQHRSGGRREVVCRTIRLQYRHCHRTGERSMGARR